MRPSHVHAACNLCLIFELRNVLTAEFCRFLRISPEEVRRVNLLPSEGVVHMATGQCLPASHLPRIWEDLDTSAEILARRKEIAAFNSTNPWRKRGIAVVPTCYGINFPLKYLNQVC